MVPARKGGNLSSIPARLRPCAVPGCPTLVSGGGRCPAHVRRYEHARGSQRARGYTVRWEHAAARFKRQYPLCGQRPNGLPPVMSQCYDKGLITPATCVDHVVPHGGDPKLFWDEIGNFQSLCNACHVRKTMAGL